MVVTRRRWCAGGAWFDGHDDEQLLAPPAIGDLSVDDDPNPIIGVIVGPDGSDLLEVRERPQLPLGFHPRR